MFGCWPSLFGVGDHGPIRYWWSLWKLGSRLLQLISRLGGFISISETIRGNVNVDIRGWSLSRFPTPECKKKIRQCAVQSPNQGKKPVRLVPMLQHPHQVVEIYVPHIHCSSTYLVASECKSGWYVVKVSYRGRIFLVKCLWEPSLKQR